MLYNLNKELQTIKINLSEIIEAYKKNIINKLYNGNIQFNLDDECLIVEIKTNNKNYIIIIDKINDEYIDHDIMIILIGNENGNLKVINNQKIYCDAHRSGKGHGYIILSGSGEGDAWRYNEGNGHAIRLGSGEGGAYRWNKGHGHAIRLGAGEGGAYRENKGKGHAIRTGSGDGNAHHNSSGDGHAIRSGSGEGNASHEYKGNGYAVRSGLGKGIAENQILKIL